VSAHVSPNVSLLDQPVSVSVSHLPPGRLVTVALSSTDALETTWTSQAEFRANGLGEVDLATASALRGSYEGVFGMGLLASMAPNGPQPDDAYYWSGGAELQFDLRVLVSGKPVAATTFWREEFSPDLTEQEETLAEQGFVGEFWAPPGPGRRPAVLAFGGSEGGLSGLLGASLASAGYPSLDIAYFKEPGLPQTLLDIPLEYFARALRWLRAQPDVNPDEIYVSGASRGSEAALLLGAYYPGLVHGVIASVPNDAALCSYPGCTGPAWTFGGKPVPYTRQVDQPYPTDDPAAVIPVEDIRGPVFLDCGEQDAVWVSCRYSDAIMARLAKYHDRHPHVLYSYADAGHGVGTLVPYEPVAAVPSSPDVAGLFPDSNGLADASLWPHLLAWLHETS
jgi:dienelactone hydrolase